MEKKEIGPATFRDPTLQDFKNSLMRGVDDFRAAPLVGMAFAGLYVVTGLMIAWVTYLSGHTFWLVLAVLGFPLIGAFAAIGLYETSRRLSVGQPVRLWDIVVVLWRMTGGQVPWFAAMLTVMLLFWFFVGHMIFAIFLGRATMTDVFSSLDVYLSADGIRMIAFGSLIGAGFATLIYAMTVLGIPMLLHREVDFVSALTRSIKAVLDAPGPYLLWGGLIGCVTLLSLIPFFLGLFIVLPVLGHATWHLYVAVSL